MSALAGNRRMALGVAVALLVASAASLCVGSVFISPGALWDAALGQGDPVVGVILWELRLPRLLLALLVGGSLGLAGAAMQGYLRNPLVEPGLLGVSGGAAFGAVLAFYSGLSGGFGYGLPLSGMAGAGAAALLVLVFGGRGASIQSLLLAGVAVSAACGALTSLVLNLSPNPYAATEIVFWLLGSLADRTRDQLLLAAPPVLLGSVLLLGCGDALRALSLGEETAASLGFRPGRVRLRVLVGTALAVGAAVSVTGAIGFVGLIVPHLLRPFAKGDPARLLPLSALGGALLLLGADLLVRLIPTTQELKLGVVTALAGAPLFLWLLIRYRRQFF